MEYMHVHLSIVAQTVVVAAPSHLCSSFSKKNAVHKNNRFQRLTLMAIATSNKKHYYWPFFVHILNTLNETCKDTTKKKTCLVFLSIVCARPYKYKEEKKNISWWKNNGLSGTVTTKIAEKPVNRKFILIWLDWLGLDCADCSFI